MAISKIHGKRRVKQKKEKVKREKWVARRLVVFNALPEEAKQGLLQKWGFNKPKSKENDPDTSSLGGLSFPVVEEGGSS